MRELKRDIAAAGADAPKLSFEVHGKSVRIHLELTPATVGELLAMFDANLDLSGLARSLDSDDERTVDHGQPRDPITETRTTTRMTTRKTSTRTTSETRSTSRSGTTTSSETRETTSSETR